MQMNIFHSTFYYYGSWIALRRGLNSNGLFSFLVHGNNRPVIKLSVADVGRFVKKISFVDFLSPSTSTTGMRIAKEHSIERIHPFVQD